MRNTYGKLMYILMDTESYSIKQELNIDFLKPIITVSSFLEDKGTLIVIILFDGLLFWFLGVIGISSMLSDPLLHKATQSVDNDMNDKSPHELELETRDKSAAMNELLRKYTGDGARCDAISTCVNIATDHGGLYFPLLQNGLWNFILPVR